MVMYMSKTIISILILVFAVSDLILNAIQLVMCRKNKKMP